VVALDKTGTLTSGNLTLAAVEVFEGEEHRFQTISHSLARLSEHPLSRAIRRIAATSGTAAMEAANF
jgi:cation transport ATPase